MIIGRSRLSAPPPLNFSTPTRENFSNSHPPKISQPIPATKKKILNPPEKLSPPPRHMLPYHAYYPQHASITNISRIGSFFVFSILSCFSRFETMLLFCTLFLESHLINTTSPHFQLPLLIFTTHYCYYHSIGILHIRWYATQLMFF